MIRRSRRGVICCLSTSLLLAACRPPLPESEEALLQAMGSLDMTVNFAAAQKLDRLYGERALLAALRNDDLHVRAVAAHFLMNHPTPESRAALLQAADDDSDEVRMWVAFSLGRIGGASEKPTLIRLREDAATRVAAVAEEAIERLDRRSKDVVVGGK